MNGKCIVATALLVCAQAAIGPASLGQDAEESSGNGKLKNRLYVEVAFGNSEADEIGTSITTRSTEVSRGTLALDDNAGGRIAVGWALPDNKGRLVARFEAYNEQDYAFQTVGAQARVVNPQTMAPAPFVAEAPIIWWSLAASPGRLSSQRTIPFWQPGVDDTDGDGIPDLDEITIAAPDLSITGTAPDELDNRVQALDLLYERGFGGRRYGGTWSTGLRYFAYEGNVPAAAWLQLDSVGTGFTDGVTARLLSYSQDSSGLGPTASLGIEQRFFRDRLVLFQKARAAFVVQSLDADSGDFFTWVRDQRQNVQISAKARTAMSLDKSSWHTGLDAGLRIKLVEGFHLSLWYAIVAFQDAVLLPTSFTIPETPSQINQDVSAVFKTQDIVMTGWFGGLSFQF